MNGNSNVIQVIRKPLSIQEGGGVRDNAFIEYGRARNYINVILPQNIIARFMVFVTVILSNSHKKILLHISSLGLPVFSSNCKLNIFTGNICIALIRISSSILRNSIVIEINDLYYEQAKDLGLFIPPYAKKFQTKLFLSGGISFIFASKSMMEYASVEYDIPANKIFYIENGGTLNSEYKDAHVSEDNSLINVVYIGTLNKGRQIEKMISVIGEIDNARLFLFGINGDWIKNNDRLIYMGAVDDRELQDAIRYFDYGLIPYDEKRMYYNIAYPTKIATYVLAGLPIISTPYKEFVDLLHNEEHIGYAFPLEHWGEIIKKGKNCEYWEIKNYVIENKVQYSWDRVMNKMDEII